MVSSDRPVMARAFGAAWHDLPPVFHRHYANRAETTDQVTVSGAMSVYTAPLLRLAKPLMRWMGLMPLHNTEQVKVTVLYASEPDGDGFWLKRLFHFSSPHAFDSCMRIQPDGSVREYMAGGVVWHLDYDWDGTAVYLVHRRFYLNLAGVVLLPLPVWLVGQCNAEEHALDESRFSAKAVLHHWLFGRLYEYAGVFTVTEDM